MNYKEIFVATIIVYIYLMIVPFPFLHYNFEWDKVYKFYVEWQTLTSAIIALCASFIALHTMQISENNRRDNENEQRERNFIAARAFLPHAFDDLTDYCDECLDKYLNSITDVQDYVNHNERSNENNNQVDMVPVLFPESAYKTIKECILYADSAFGEHLIKLVGKLQIQNSRIHSHFNKHNNEHLYCNLKALDHKKSAYHEILNTFLIRYVISCTLNFARGESSEYKCDNELFDPIAWLEYPEYEKKISSKRRTEIAEYFKSHPRTFLW